MAVWAPITSLLSLLTSAPVRVREKNASGIDWTWRNTATRRSSISPSPSRAENQRPVSPTTASRTAIPAIAPAITITTRAASGRSFAATIVLTTRPASTGVATPITAVTVVRAR